MTRIIMGFLFSLSSHVHAQGVSDPARASMMDPKSVQGICTSQNAQERQVMVGECESLKEMLRGEHPKECVADLVEKLRLRYLGKAKKDDKNKDKGFGVGLSCSGKNKKTGEAFGLEEIAEDKAKFNEFLVNFFFAVYLNESKLDPLNREKAGEPQGIANLSTKDMDDEKFACGCQVTNSANSHDPTKGYLKESPGPLNAHHSVMCGAYMSLYWAEKDGELFGGSEKAKDKDGKPKGATKVFKSLDRDPETEGIDKEPPEFKRLSGKIDKFCELTSPPKPSKTNEFKDTRPDNGQAPATR